MSERKAYSTKLDNELMVEIRELAKRKTKHQNDLIEEAIQDILKKYKDRDRPEPYFTRPFLLQTLPKNTKQDIH